MLHPSYSDLMKVVNSEVEPGEAKVVNSRYSIVMATSRRARQIVAGDEPYVESDGKKALSVAEIKKTPKEFIEETIEREKNLLRKILVDPQKYEEEITRRERKGISLEAILKAIKV